LLKLDGKVVAVIRKNGLKFTQAEHVAKVLKAGSLSDALEAAKALASGQVSRRSAERALNNETPENAKRKHVLKTRGAHYRALIDIESDIPIDSVRARQLEELVTTLDRIMTWAA
jgi:hypothetical protein